MSMRVLGSRARLGGGIYIRRFQERRDVPICQCEPVGGQDRAVTVNQDGFNAEQRCDLAGMLSARATKASQSESLM